MNFIQRVRRSQFQLILSQWLFSHHLRFFAPNKSATLLLGAVNNASIPPQCGSRILQRWDEGHPFSHCYGPAPGPRDLKRRSRTSPRCTGSRRGMVTAVLLRAQMIVSAGTWLQTMVKTLTLACTATLKTNEGKQLGGLHE